MSVWRVMGTETEYGIIVPGNPGANAMLISSQIVNAYAQPSAVRNRRPRWDFEEENPLRDARGFDLAREVADASQLTDEDVGLANVILTNGARLLRRPRAPGVLRARVHQPARRRDLGQGRRADHGRGQPARRA